jgi:hypothetical protein
LKAVADIYGNRLVDNPGKRVVEKSKMKKC